MFRILFTFGRCFSFGYNASLYKRMDPEEIDQVHQNPAPRADVDGWVGLEDRKFPNIASKAVSNTFSFKLGVSVYLAANDHNSQSMGII